MNSPENYERYGSEDRTTFYLFDASHPDPLGLAKDVHKIAMCINSLDLTNDSASDFLVAAVDGFVAVVEELLGQQNCLEVFLNFHSAVEESAQQAAESIENTLLDVDLLGSPLVSVGIWSGNDAVRSLRDELATLTVDAGFEAHRSKLDLMVTRLDEALNNSSHSVQCAVAGILRAETF